MGHTFTYAGAFADFTVTKSNPSGNIVRFTVTDSSNLLKDDPRMIRSVLADAIQQWIDAERADLDTNGDSTVKGSADSPYEGDGFASFTWVFGSLYAQVNLTALTNISSTGTLTASIPYAPVV